MGVNLHVHSNNSDGKLNFNELINLSVKEKLSTISITDHNNVDGYLSRFKEEGIEIIPGIEIDCNYNNNELHILGYFINANIMNKKLEILSSKKTDRNCDILKKLKENNVLFSSEELESLKFDRKGFRKRLIFTMIKKGYVNTIGEAMKRYIGPNGVAFMLPDINPIDVINIIKDSYGVPVIAHPCLFYKEWSKVDIYDSLKYMKNIGIEGIETYYEKCKSRDISTFSEIANKLNLISTGGTDFHTLTDKIAYDFPFSLNALEKLRLCING